MVNLFPSAAGSRPLPGLACNCGLAPGDNSGPCACGAAKTAHRDPDRSWAKSRLSPVPFCSAAFARETIPAASAGMTPKSVRSMTPTAAKFLDGRMMGVALKLPLNALASGGRQQVNSGRNSTSVEDAAVQVTPLGLLHRAKLGALMTATPAAPAKRRKRRRGKSGKRPRAVLTIGPVDGFGAAHPLRDAKMLRRGAFTSDSRLSDRPRTSRRRRLRTSSCRPQTD